MNNAGKIALGIAGAAAAGALVGLLVAPQKGSELQKTVSNRGSKIINQLIDFILFKQKSAAPKGRHKAAATGHHK